MGLLTSLLLLPVAGPGRGALWLAAKIHETAEAEYRDPAAIRQALRDLETALDQGEIDEEVFEEAEQILLDRLDGTA